jgi:pimeloyl-ACP methyl ester carboxylesterase
MTRIGRGVALETLDWGGKGPPLVFLAGLGSTAHVFDDFAPRFTDHFHVVGITRRGFGASSSAPPPRDLDTLVADIAAVIDSLRLGQVILVGHSIAGEEMTRFAEVDSSRCAALVYLDAAYDRSDVSAVAQSQPRVPPPTIRPEDFVSFASVTAFHARVMGVREPESEIRATSRFDSRDRYLGDVTADSLKARVVSGRRVARYDRSRCRALALFAGADSLADVVPYFAELDASGRENAEALRRFVASVVADARARFLRFPQNEAVGMPGNHFIHLQRPRDVEAVMRTFLWKVQPSNDVAAGATTSLPHTRR